MPRTRTHLSAVTTNKSPPLALPGEIRNKIYEYALISRSGSIAEYARRDNDQGLGVKSEVSHDLLLTCRQIFNEGYDFCFAKNTFFFSRCSDLLDFLENLGPKGRKIISLSQSRFSGRVSTFVRSELSDICLSTWESDGLLLRLLGRSEVCRMCQSQTSII